jgi:hypothetical protein
MCLSTAACNLPNTFVAPDCFRMRSERAREREIAEAYPTDVAMSQSMSQSRQVWGNISHGPRIVLFLATALAVLSLSRYLYRYLRVRLYSTSGPAARMVLIPTLIIPVLIAITTAQSSMVGGGPR